MEKEPEGLSHTRTNAIGKTVSWMAVGNIIQFKQDNPQQCHLAQLDRSASMVERARVRSTYAGRS